ATVRKEMLTMTQLGLIFERMDHVPISAKASGPALRFANHAQFHPLKYLIALAGIIRNHGGSIHTATQRANTASGSPCIVNTKTGGVITADAVVVATGSPFDTGVAMHMKVAAYITYAIALEILPGSVLPALYWDTEDPYHYVRIAPTDTGKELLI